MILKVFYHWIAGILFGRSVGHNNIIEAISFVATMRRAILSMSPASIVHYKIPSATLGYVCIDYGLIFSASHQIQRYIIVRGGTKIYLEDDEYITLYEN